MSCLWVALACLTAGTVVNADLADFVKNQLASHRVYKCPIFVGDVTEIPDIYKPELKAKVSGGSLTYTDLDVTVVSQTDTKLVFNVTGEATCTFKKYVMDQTVMPGWTSSSARGENRFQVTLQVSDCVVQPPALVRAQKIEGIDICKTSAMKEPHPLISKMEKNIGERLTTEVMIKLMLALKQAANSLNLKGSGFAGC